MSDYWDSYWHRKASRRDILRTAGGLSVFGVLAACAPTTTQPTGSSAPAPSDPTAGVAQTLRHALANPPVTLDPNGTALSSSYFYALYDALTRVDEKAKIHPGLASEWKSVSPNVWEFTLRDTVWSDGTPFTSDDVVFTYEYVKDTANKSAIASRIANVTGVAAAGPRAVRITTSGPDPLMPARAFFIPILPKAHIAKVGMSQFGLNPIGTGPFMVKDYKQGTRLDLVRNEKSWRKPKLTEITLFEMPDATSRLAALRSGEMDAIDVLDRENAERMRTEGFQVLVADGAGSYSFDLEFFQPPFNDKRVRIALNHAIDKETILKTLLKGFGNVMAGQPIPKNVFGHNPNLKPFEYDPKKARDLLAAAGAENLEIPMEFTTVAPEPRLISEAMFQYLKDVGLRPELKPVETAIWRTHIYEGGRPPIFYNPWSAQAPLDAEFILSWYGANSFGGKPYWKNDAFEAAYSKSQVELDPAKRETHLHTALAAMHDDPPILFTIQSTQLFGVNKKVQGFVGNPSGYVWYDDISIIKA